MTSHVGRQTDSKTHLLWQSYAHSFTVSALGPSLRLRALLLAVGQQEHGCISSLDVGLCKAGETGNRRGANGGNCELKIVEASPNQCQTQSRSTVSILTFFPQYCLMKIFTVLVWVMAEEWEGTGAQPCHCWSPEKLCHCLLRAPHRRKLQLSSLMLYWTC